MENVSIIKWNINGFFNNLEECYAPDKSEEPKHHVPRRVTPTTKALP